MLLTVFLLYLIGSACAVKQNVEYYSGRSADIVIQSTNDVASGTSALLLHGEQFNNNNLKSIEDTRVADLLAHVMGTQPFNADANRKDFPKGNIFNKAKAALLFTLDAVSPDLLTANLEHFQRVELTTTSFPSNSFSMASSIATGASPSSHGIIAQQWLAPNGNKVNAHEGTAGASASANIADILAQEWSKASLTVSASASSPFTTAFAVNKRFAGADSYAFLVNNGAFENIYSQAQTMTDSAYQTILESVSFGQVLGVSYNQRKLTVAGSDIIFDLQSETEASLVAEVAFVYNFIRALKSDAKLAAAVADEVPDFFAFSFSSLKALKEQHGEESAAFTAAVTMTIKVIKYAVEQIDALYGGRAVTAVAALNTNTVVSPATKVAAFAVARKYVNEADFEKYYPSLYTVNRADAHKLCNELKNSVEDASTTVNCFTTSYSANMEGVYVAVGNSSGNHTYKKPLNVPAFWIILWIAVVLSLFVAAGVYFLCSAGIEAANDSLLFRSTGRHLHQN